MNITKKLVVGLLLFVVTLAFSIPLQSGRAFALTATSLDQLNKLAASLKYNGSDTFTGTMAGKTITFKKISQAGPGGVPTSVATFEAQNLDCNGEKANVTANFSLGQIAQGNSPGALNAKFKSGGNCSEKKSIQISVNQDGQATATGDVNGSGAADTGKSCDVTLTSPLSWILCPVIEGGSNFVDFVFKDIVKPLLAEVPISSDPNDGGYKAWKQFRLLGNIVLVGTMLAVVYAQVRGDR